MRGPECQFSFADLFLAAEGRMWTPEEEATFVALTQPQKNEWVSKLVAKAPGFVTADRLGTDGISYRVFWKP